MANYPSAIKRNRQAPKRRARNRLVISSMRTALKKARTAIEGGAGEKTTLVKDAISLVDRAVTKGALKRQTASRTISRLQSALNKS